MSLPLRTVLFSQTNLFLWHCLLGLNIKFDSSSSGFIIVYFNNYFNQVISEDQQ